MAQIIVKVGRVSDKNYARPVEEAGDENGEEQHGHNDEGRHEEGEYVLLVRDQQRELGLLRRLCQIENYHLTMIRKKF